MNFIFKFVSILIDINVVGMSIEKLFDMWRNYEFSRNLFFEVQNWDSQDSAETAAHIT